MRILLIAFTALLIASCTKPDAELIQGEWGFSKITKGKDIIVSADPKEQDVIIKKALKQFGPQLAMMNMTEADFKASMKKDMDLMLKVTFKFDKSNVTVSNNNPQNANSTKSKYKLNVEKHELTITEKTNENVYKYEMTDDMLTLKDPKNKDEIIFKRKKA